MTLHRPNRWGTKCLVQEWLNLLLARQISYNTYFLLHLDTAFPHYRCIVIRCKVLYNGRNNIILLQYTKIINDIN